MKGGICIIRCAVGHVNCTENTTALMSKFVVHYQNKVLLQQTTVVSDFEVISLNTIHLALPISYF